MANERRVNGINFIVMGPDGMRRESGVPNGRASEPRYVLHRCWAAMVVEIRGSSADLKVESNKEVLG